MTSVRATPFVLIFLGLIFALFPGTLVRREEEATTGVMGFMSSLFGGLLSFIPANRQSLVARGLGVLMFTSGVWMLTSLHGVGNSSPSAGGHPATAASLVEASQEFESISEISVSSVAPVEIEADASVQESEKEELIAIATSDEPAEEGELLVAEETGADDLAESGADSGIEPVSISPEVDEAEGNAAEMLAGIREKPSIPDEPSPFIDTFPKPVAPKADARKAPAAKPNSAAPGGGNSKAVPKQTPDPFGAAKVKPVAERTPPKPEPKVIAEPEIVEPPAEPNPAKLAEADDLLKKAKMMWELEEYASSVKLAEKARKLRVSQLGEGHAKVEEVDAMLEVARTKIEKP